MAASDVEERMSALRPKMLGCVDDDVESGLGYPTPIQYILRGRFGWPSFISLADGSAGPDPRLAYHTPPPNGLTRDGRNRNEKKVNEVLGAAWKSLGAGFENGKTRISISQAPEICSGRAIGPYQGSGFELTSRCWKGDNGAKAGGSAEPRDHFTAVTAMRRSIRGICARSGQAGSVSANEELENKGRSILRAEISTFGKLPARQYCSRDEVKSTAARQCRRRSGGKVRRDFTMTPSRSRGPGYVAASRETPSAATASGHRRNGRADAGERGPSNCPEALGRILP